ncbi:MAG TPA: DUF192 domain-containing protein [Tepidisphaeraceae bacterium]
MTLHRGRIQNNRAHFSARCIAAYGFAACAPSRTRCAARVLFNLVFLSFSLLFLVGCDEQSPAGLPTVKMQIGHRTFVLEVARTQAEQEKGLMKRDSMPADHGMIFPFKEERVLSFWMKDTRFPLDIVFADSKGKVVSIHQMEAYDENSTSSDFPARYAIELNKGAAKDAGVKVGDVLDIPPPARAKD